MKKEDRAIIAIMIITFIGLLLVGLIASFHYIKGYKAEVEEKCFDGIVYEMYSDGRFYKNTSKKCK